ncbi:MAG TPA: hypothetical protein VFH78_06230 [Candidatus Thermoplasmatota archaeon]|nr:hypothetical protein [Candidatus Thermoplasmatota archaeon]
MHSDTQRRELLHLCRSVMPTAAGVIVSTLSGSVLAHEPRVRDPDALAREAAATRAADTSALVARDGGLYFVVFVPQAAVAPVPAPVPT